MQRLPNCLKLFLCRPMVHQHNSVAQSALLRTAASLPRTSCDGLPDLQNPEPTAEARTLTNWTADAAGLRLPRASRERVHAESVSGADLASPASPASNDLLLSHAEAAPVGKSYEALIADLPDCQMTSDRSPALLERFEPGVDADAAALTQKTWRFMVLSSSFAVALVASLWICWYMFEGPQEQQSFSSPYGWMAAMCGAVCFSFTEVTPPPWPWRATDAVGWGVWQGQGCAYCWAYPLLRAVLGLRERPSPEGSSDDEPPSGRQRLRPPVVLVCRRRPSLTASSSDEEPPRRRPPPRQGRSGPPLL